MGILLPKKYDISGFLLEHFIKQTPLFSEECSSIIIRQKKSHIESILNNISSRRWHSPFILRDNLWCERYRGNKKAVFLLVQPQMGRKWSLLEAEMLTFFFFPLSSLLHFHSLFLFFCQVNKNGRKFFIFLDLHTAILAREAKKLMVSYLLWFLLFCVQTFIRLTAKSWTQQNCQHFTGHFWNRFCL